MGDANGTLCIIAGGRGERLGGVAKGLLRVDGKTSIERILSLASLFEDALIVANDPAPYASCGVRILGDAIPGKGAPGGVHAALEGARTEWILAVACDMPFVTERVVRRLLEARTASADAVAFFLDGRLEPLCACYRTRLASLWRPKLLAGDPSFRTLLEGAALITLDEASLREVDPLGRALVSLNREEDLARYGAEKPRKGAFTTE